jgi:uncharacterized protein (DUF58 family)
MSETTSLTRHAAWLPLKGWIRPTGFGVAHALITLVVYAVSVNNSNNLVTLLAVILASVLLVSYLQLCFFAKDVKIESLVDHTDLYDGDALDIEFSLTKGRPDYVQDSLFLEVSGHEGQFKWNARDNQVKGHLSLLGLTRGCYENLSIKGRFYSPFGLFSVTKSVSVIPRIWVYPKPIMHKVQKKQALGHSTLDHNADSVEGVKAYTQDDSVKRIRWQAFAKHDQLLVNQLEGEEEALMVELNWSMTEGLDLPARFECLSAWIQQCYKSQIPFALRLPNMYAPAAKGPVHYRNCQRWLTTLETEPQV